MSLRLVNREAPCRGSEPKGKDKAKGKKDKGDGQLELSAAANATVGQHTAKLRIRTKFGAVTKDTVHELPLIVEAAAKE